jgi:thioredoxin reductase (NADPH)
MEEDIPMVDTTVTVYGAHWCPDCRRSKKFLGEQFIPFKWVDIEQDKEGERFVIQKNGGKRIIPTIVFGDGSLLVEPSNAELAKKLGLKTEARKTYYDLTIVGGGPAGLTAAIYASREGADTLLLERSGLGGQAGITVGLDNFPGFPEGIAGQDFAARVTQQASRFGVEIVQAVDVERMHMEAGYHEIYTSDGKHYHSRAVLLATGASYRRLGVPGEDDYIGAGIHFCATCDGPFYKGARDIVVVGGGNSAVEEGLHLTNFAEKVTLLVRGHELTASQIAIDKVKEPASRVDVKCNVIVDAFEGQDARLKTIRYHHTDSGLTEEIHPAAAFIFIGQVPNTSFVKEYVEMDKFGFVLTGHDLTHDDMHAHRARPFETSVPGIFVAGDARHGSTKQVASAVGEGAAAAISIREFLRSK